MTTFRIAGIPKPAQIGLLLAGTAAAVVTGRLMRKRSSGPSERLAAAMLDTTLLESARRDSHAAPLLAITACAGYIVHLLEESAADSGLARSTAGAVGTSSKVVHPYSGATASVFTQQVQPDEELVFKLDFNGVCHVRGARTVGPVRLAGITPSRRVHDLVQIDLGEQYTVQIETDMSVADFVATGSNRIQGDMTLEDGCGNAGRLTVQGDGSVTGPLRNGSQVFGRFAGSIAGGIQFLSFHNEGRNDARNDAGHNTSGVPGDSTA
jgi:hypothetical protein